MWRWKAILYYQDPGTKSQVFTESACPGSTSESNQIRLGVFDKNTEIMSSLNMFAQTLKEEAVEKSIRHAFQAVVLMLGCTLEVLGENLNRPEILTFLAWGAAWELEFLKHLR